MKNEKIFKAIGRVDDQYIKEAAPAVPKEKKTQKRSWVKWGAVAACLSLLIFGAALLFNDTTPGFDLTRSTGSVSVKYIDPDEVPTGVNSNVALPYLSEEELFTKYEMIAFKGTVQNIENILIKFGEAFQYYSIATIQVDKVYKGDIETESLLRVLVPYAYSDGVGIEDSETVANLKVGMTGIFTPKKCDETGATDDFRQWGESRIVLADIAAYRFSDGVRWMFLDTNEGLVFDRYSYDGAADAKTLEDIESYIYMMLSNS